MNMRTAILPETATKTSQGNPPPASPESELIKYTGVAVASSPDGLVRYVTVEELMRSNRPVRLRIELIAMWVVLLVGLCLVFQVLGYQHGLRIGYASQDRSIDILRTALSIEDKKLKRVIGNSEKMTAETASQMKALETKVSADEHVALLLTHRLSNLEAAPTSHDPPLN